MVTEAEVSAVEAVAGLKGIDDLFASGGNVQRIDAAKYLEFAEQADEARKGSAGYFTVVSAADLDAGDYRIEYLVPGIIAANQPLILAGQFKTLKTSILFDMAVSLASGTQFLGQFPTNQKRVLVLTAESGLATVQETCRRICRSRELTLGNIDGLSFCDAVPRLENEEHLKQLREIVKKGKFDVVAADPAYLMLDGDQAGNLFNMGDQLRVFSDLALKSNATPILLHHARKNNQNATEYQPLELSDLAWAGFAEFARQWMLLSRRERYREGTGDHQLWMSVGGSAGHNGCWGLSISEGHPDDEGGRQWDVKVNGSQEARESAAEESSRRREEAKARREQKCIDAAREKVVSAFRGIKPPRLTTKQIRERAGISTPVAGKTIAYMLRVGELTDGVRVTAGNNQSYDAFQLEYDQLGQEK